MNYMKIDQTLEQKLNLSLERNLKKLTTTHDLDHSYLYATLPAGKLFRPKLAWSLFLDFDPSVAQLILESDIKIFENHNITLLAESLEIHHAYTLVHDDMPCMDNDLERRGKPSVHVQYGEWVALLTGDGLLNISYQLLAKIHHKNLNLIFKIYTHSTGPKGLIHGQLLDLNHDMNKSLENLLKTHELKTARLIQLALTLPCLLLDKELKVVKKFWRLGRSLGIVFQLLDDLQELTEEKLTLHEKEINPFILFFERTMPILLKELEVIERELLSNKYTNLMNLISLYLSKTGQKLFKNQSTIESHFQNGQSIDELKKFKSLIPDQ